MGWNPVKEAEKKAKQAIDKIVKPAAEKVGKEIRDSVRKLGKWYQGEIEKKGKWFVGEVEKVGKKAVGEVEDIGKKAVQEVEEKGKVVVGEVEEHVKEYLDALAKAVTKEALVKVRDMCRTTHTEMAKLEESRPVLADKINAVAFTMKLGPVTLVFTNFYERVEDLTKALDRFISEPPAFRRGPVIGLIEALGPTSIDLGISVEFALVIGSNELGVGGELSEIELELATEIADIILEKLGVPE